MGGTALRISQADFYTPQLSYFHKQGLISSYGQGAIGVSIAVPLTAYCLNIQVRGDSSTAVYTDQDVELRYCRLSAEGDASAASSGRGSAYLNTCAISSAVQPAYAVTYSIVDLVSQPLYYPVKQGSYMDYVDSKNTFLLSSSLDGTTILESFSLLWERDPYEIDTKDLGFVTIQGYLELPFQGLGIEGDYPLELTIEVRDPSLPCIYEVSSYNNSLGQYTAFFFWDSYEPADGTVTLWRSDDNGESWYDYTNSENIEWSGDVLYYYYEEISDTALFKLEEKDSGFSNIAYIHTINGIISSGMGGDRNGTDRNTPEKTIPDEIDSSRTDSDKTDTNEIGSVCSVSDQTPASVSIFKSVPGIAQVGSADPGLTDDTTVLETSYVDDTGNSNGLDNSVSAESETAADTPAETSSGQNMQSQENNTAKPKTANRGFLYAAIILAVIGAMAMLGLLGLQFYKEQRK